MRHTVEDFDSIDWPRVFLVILLLVTAAGLVVAASTSGTAFDPYNPAWDGSSGLQDLIDDDPTVERELVRNTDEYGTTDPASTTAFVVAPAEPYDEGAMADLSDFLDAGGTIVVFENFAAGDADLEVGGNALLRALDAEARIDGRYVRDEEYHDRGPLMPLATGIENHTTTEGVDELALNYGSVIDSRNATVLVRTSPYAYLVEDPSDDPDDDEIELDAYPVATTESVGEGTVVVVADPSITTNAMLERSDNAAFLTALYGDDDHVLIDVSHGGDVPPLVAALLIVRGSPALQGLVGVLGIGLIAIATSGRSFTLADRRRLRISDRLRILGRFRSRVSDRVRGGAAPDDAPHATLTDEEWAAVLRNRHPEWDEERIRRVIKAVNRTDSKRGVTNERD